MLLTDCLFTSGLQELLFSLSSANDTMYDCIKARQSAVSTQLVTSNILLSMCWKLLLLLPVLAAISSRVREDGRCGPDFPQEDGSPGPCDPNSDGFCCSASGWCGNTEAHCTCDTCVNYGTQLICCYRQVSFTVAVHVAMQFFTVLQDVAWAISKRRQWREDGRCGPMFLLEDGSPAACDPNSPNFCCSNSGWCGNTEQHCSCDTCVNYRQHSAGDIQPSKLNNQK